MDPVSINLDGGNILEEKVEIFYYEVFPRPLWALLECLTAACKALSLANAKGKGTNGSVIRSLDD